MKKTTNYSFQLRALLLVAGLLLHGCKSDGGSGSDTMPDAYAFASQSLAAPDTLVESQSATISGITGPAPVSITGGEYSIDGDAYRAGRGSIENGQQIRIRLRSSAESMGQTSATLNIGGVAGKFKVETLMIGRIEAETANLTGGASTVADGAASHGEVVSVGSAGRGISITASVDGKALIVMYRADMAGTLEATVNGNAAGEFTLQPTAGAFATSGFVVSVNAGDVIAIASPSAAGASETYIDFVDFSDTIFKSVSTLAQTAPNTTDGVAIAANGDIYVSGGPGGQTIYRVTPAGVMSTFATGLGSANGSDFDSNGNLYVADYNGSAVRRITPAGVMTTLASGLNGPAGVWVAPDDYVFVTLFGAGFSGTGATVLRIAPNGTVSTYASGGGLQDVIGILGDENGEMYASNWAGGALYKITGGTVTLLAQTGGSANHICYSDGYIYVPSPGDALIRRISLTGTVETFAGTTTRQTVDGPITSADFERPNSCDLNADGSIMYVMDRDNGLLRKIDSWMH